MLSIQQSNTSKPNPITTNILPCEIAYTGKIDNVKRFWNPQLETIKDANGADTQVEIAYFRGRKLLGRTAKLPEGYRGVVVSGEKQPAVQQGELQQGSSVFSRIARREAGDESDGDYGESAGGLKADGREDDVQLEVMNEVSSFDKVMVWEHEVLPDAQEAFGRGVEEWLAFAKTVHNTDP